MNHPSAYGKFIKRGQSIYRTSAYIQWGEGEQSIGACLLLNPGSATLDHEMTSLLDINGVASGRIKTADPTMAQLISLVEGIYGEAITGRFHLYNLFNLRNSKSVNAVEQFEAFVESGEYDIAESLVSVAELKLHPWILLGWGITKGKKWGKLELAKEKWRNLIQEAQIPVFGKKHKRQDDYYHPCPLIATKRPIMLQELIARYKQKFGVQRFPVHATKPNLLIESNLIDHIEEQTSGWYRTSNNPELVVQGFSHLHIKDGYKLRAYQYYSRGNGNGIVWAIPAKEELPEPHTCEQIDGHFLNAPKPSNALADFMKVIAGDNSPVSYLQAAIVYHELHEFGAIWHGVSWGRDVILPQETNTAHSTHDWEMIEEAPEIIEPHFYYNQEGNPVIIFHTINDIGIVRLNRYTHVFSKEDYTLTVERTCIATAGPGIIF